MIGGKDVRRGLHATLSALLLMAAVVAMRPNPADAQSVLSGGIIEEIRVEGTQRIDPTTVLSYLRVSPGDSFDPVRINESLKDLFGSGLFADVTLRREGDALVVVVTENPIINRVAFEGNRRIDDAILDSETELRQRKVFTRTKVQSDVQRILEVYRRQGARWRTGELLFRNDRGGSLNRKSNNAILTTAFEKAGIPRMQGNLWTVLRKTWTTRVYDNGATAEQEAEWGGHSITVANKHYREHGRNVTRGAAGLLDRRTDRVQDRARKVANR